MNARRAQDLLRHITQDKDYGADMMTRISVAESIYVINQILPECVGQAQEKNNVNDAGYFGSMITKYRPIVIEKIKSAERLWIVYCDSTGYPYMADSEMFVLFDYANHAEIGAKLEKAGFKVAFMPVEPADFKNEVAHMYRNGYKKIRFIDGKCEPLTVEREELYDYSEFYKDEYITNPALQQGMIDFFQEFRKELPLAEREPLLKKREDAMLLAMRNSEYMVPCVKEENDEEVEIQHPFIDLTDKIKDKKEGEQVIAVPVFSDGFEMDKCYEGHHENMLYKFDELVTLIDELGASGIIINCLGISYYMNKELMNKVNV